MPADELLQKTRQAFGGSIIGTPQEVVAQLRAYTFCGIFVEKALALGRSRR